VLGRLIKPAYLGARSLFLRVFVHSNRSIPIPGDVRSLVVFTDGRLGDVCLAIPVLQCLRATYPDANFAIVLPAHLHSLVQWSCHPNNVFEHSEKRKVEEFEWDVAIDLSTDYYLKTARLALQTGARVRIGFEFNGRGAYFTHAITEPPLTEHVQNTYARVLSVLGISFRPIPLPERIPADVLDEWDPEAVAIHPGAHHPTQRWPAEYFAELIREIHGGNQHCLVLGTSEERELVTRIVNLAEARATAAITNDVLQLAATIRHSQMLICNNSGPLHLAGLLGVPTLSLMGPTVKSRWWPVGKHAIVLRRNDLPCIGCNLAYCKIRTHACMREVKPEEVFTAYFRLRATLLLESST